jgi:hypothetical protein
LPPSIILEVMKILEQQIGLRDETRALEQAKAALETPQYQQRAEPLATHQADLTRRVADVTQEIREVPDGEAMFGQEIAMLTRVEQVMDEAHELLVRPDTGPETIAAQTEAIELLLQTRRINPGGGGGGGSTPGGGSNGETQRSALALIGSGAERDAAYEARTVGQATGRTGSDLPAEYRTGLDAYFSALEGSRLIEPDGNVQQE